MVYEEQPITMVINKSDAEWLHRLLLDSAERVGAEEHINKLIASIEQGANPRIIAQTRRATEPTGRLEPYRPPIGSCPCEWARDAYMAARLAWDLARKAYDGTEESANRIKDLELAVRRTFTDWNIAPSICEKHREMNKAIEAHSHERR